MKKLIIGLALTLMLLALGIIYTVYAATNPMPLFGKVIYLDPGHGGKDPGTNYRSIYEKNINLEVSKKLEQILVNKGAIVYMTRYGDYDLSSPQTGARKYSDLMERVKLINYVNPDIYLSIHVNAYRSSRWQGATVYYDDINPINEHLAKIMQNSFKERLNSKRHYMEVYNMFINRRVKSPGLLIEVGFMSNPDERNKLINSLYQKKIAEAIYNGIIIFKNQNT